MLPPFFTTLKNRIFLFSPLLAFAVLPFRYAPQQTDTKPPVSDTLKSEPSPLETKEVVPASGSQSLIADRLHCIEKTIPLTYSRRVHSFIDYFTIRERNYTRLMMSRLNLYFPLFETYLARYNLPLELKYLTILESGLNPNATSRAGAVGLWQFMPLTGQQFGLSINWYVDERRDPDKATQAACLYLMSLYKRFKNWELVLLAYNSGPNKVRAAMRRARYHKQAVNFHRYLPAETRSYLSQFTAINYSLSYPKEHRLRTPIEEKPTPYDTLAVKGFLNLKILALLTKTNLEKLSKLNPILIRQVVPQDGRTYILKMPIQTKKRLIANRATILDSASKVIPQAITAHEKKIREKLQGRKQIFYVVKPGDMLLSIAYKFHVSVRDIQTWNNLKTPFIQTRQRLRIWVPYQKISPHMSKGKMMPSLDHGKIYVVEVGDTLWDISQKFKGLSVEKIKALNKLRSTRLQPGQKLVLQ